MAKKDPKSAPQQSQQLKKKKKTEKEKGPQQQPALLLPPDEETQSLHPRKLSKKYGSDSIIKLLQHEARNCPMKNAPPKKLLTLVGGFLTSYGFNSACGLFQLQCNARNNLDGWDSVVGAELPKDHPNLLQVYQEWEKNDRATKLLTNGDGLKETKEFKDEKIRQEEEDPDYTSSSGITTSEDDSNSSSDSDILANSDVEMKDETSKSAKGVKEKKKSASTSISKSRGSFSSSFSSSSNSDNDTDDKKEPADDRTTTSKPNVTSLIQNLKKSSDAAKSVASSLSKGLLSDRNKYRAKIELQAKKSDKPVEKLKKAAEPTSSSSSSAASGSDSDSSSSSASSVVSKLADNETQTKWTLKGS